MAGKKEQKEADMFCYQCEQTAKGEGCTKAGVCGKQPDVASLQDLLVHVLAELSFYAVEGRKVGVINHEINVFTVEALFSTLTNVDFDANRFVELVQRSVKLRDVLKEEIKAAGGKTDLPAGYRAFKPEATLEGLVKQGEEVGLTSDPNINPDIRSLQHTLLFGIKGVAAYAYHAQILGQEDDAVYAYIHKAMAEILKNTLLLNDWLSLVLSWYEQKAVAILLTLLHLGIKNMRLGPTLPAFITPNILDVLVKTFDIKPITTPEEDLKAILG